MTAVNSHPPGSFCWIELATTDAASATSFYTQLFGWSVDESDMGDGSLYTIFQKNGRNAAAMYAIRPEQQGMPPNWMSYVAVASADDATRKAKDLGATVRAEPFDVSDYGRMSVLADPTGASFAVWQAKQEIGLGVRDEENTLCWNELQARDLERAKHFYVSLFGWRPKESPEYTEFHLGEHAIGGMLSSHAPAEVPPYWLPYFAVADCDATVARAGSLGGSICAPPMDIANVGRFAVLGDPQGATFAVIRLTM
jgi:predicted enzyme related to lactoylglutathione lyase